MEEREKSAEDKTEEPTDERKKQFREQGNIASPREILSSLTLLVMVIILGNMAPKLINGISSTISLSFGQITKKALNAEEIFVLIGNILYPLFMPLLAFTGLMTVFPILLGFSITRFHWSWKKMSLDLTKLNPISGITRIANADSLIELIKSILKMTALTAVTYIVLKKYSLTSVSAVFMKDRTLLETIGSSLKHLCMSLAISGFVIGCMDFGVSWFKLSRKMRMTKQEIKDEVKSQEGDPHAKSARKRMARDIVLRQNISNVNQATFVVTNPEHFAVAIRYVNGMAAPLIVAKGQDFLALKIREEAKRCEIVLIENKPLARTLYKTVKIGGEVPQSLYASIIEVMKQIYRIKGKDYFRKFEEAA
jgi:flagellar biosynthesis protein FlhB